MKEFILYLIYLLIIFVIGCCTGTWLQELLAARLWL